MIKHNLWVGAIGFLLISMAACGQGTEFVTRQLAAGQAPAPATLADAAWIAGHWQGTAMGGQTEEIWGPPLGNSMLGSFRLVNEAGAIRFCELMTITEVEGSLRLSIKHFDGELVGWEAVEESETAMLVAVEPEAVHFDDLSFVRVDEDHLTIVVRSMDKDDPTIIEELVFEYSRFQ